MINRVRDTNMVLKDDALGNLKTRTLPYNAQNVG